MAFRPAFTSAFSPAFRSSYNADVGGNLRLLDQYSDAAAAYSLRGLSASVSNVVRVRRESDNNERDFTAKEVSNGTLQNWTNAQVIPPLDVRELTATGRDGPIIEAAAAYSLRNLSDSYAGDVVEVRRSSDDAEDSFTAAEVADGTLVTWVGSGNDGTVSKWYDQSTTSGVPNANHAVQTSAASQPKIVDGGTLVAGGLAFDGVNDGLAVSGQVLTSSSLYVASVMQHATGTSTSDGQNVFGQYQVGVSGRFQLSANVSSEYSFFANATDSIAGFSTGAIGTSQTLISVNGDGSNAEIWRDGTSKATDTYSGFTPAARDFTIGIDAGGEREFNGKITELIVYNTDQTDNRTALEANIGEVYGIAGIPAYDNTVNGFVETWYDQSGNGNNATQLTASKQPKIVDAGNLIVGGLAFDGVNDRLSFASSVALSSNDFFISSVFKVLEGDGIDIAPIGNVTGNTFVMKLDYDDNQAQMRTNDGSFITRSFAPNEPTGNILTTMERVGNAAFLYHQSSKKATFNVTGESFTLGNFGQWGPTQYSKHLLNEIIVYPSDQSANRVGIEANIKKQYDI